MKKSILSSLLLVLLIVFGCNDKTAQREIEKKINKLYSKQLNVYDPKLDTTLFTNEIVSAIQSVKETTKADDERIKSSDTPTDTPVLLEGSVFTSLYDGYSRYTVKEVLVKGDSAEVWVEFEYDDQPKIEWKDKILLINKNGWRVADIRFTGKYANHKDLKERLSSVKLK